MEHKGGFTSHISFIHLPSQSCSWSLSPWFLFIPCSAQGFHHCLASLPVSCCSPSFFPGHSDNFQFCFCCAFPHYPWSASSPLALGVPVPHLSCYVIWVFPQYMSQPCPFSLHHFQSHPFLFCLAPEFFMCDIFFCPSNIADLSKFMKI